MAVNVDDPKGGKRSEEEREPTQNGPEDDDKKSGVGDHEYIVTPKP